MYMYNTYLEVATMVGLKLARISFIRPILNPWEYDVYIFIVDDLVLLSFKSS